MRQISERTQSIINAIIENDKLEKPLSQVKLGEQYGITGPRISQIRAKYISKAEGIPAHVSEFETPVAAFVEANRIVDAKAGPLEEALNKLINYKDGPEPEAV